MLIEPFSIDIPDSALEDLRHRLLNARLPKPLAEQGWSEGMDMDVLRELLAHWSTAFDWHAQEADAETAFLQRAGAFADAAGAYVGGYQGVFSGLALIESKMCLGLDHAPSTEIFIAANATQLSTPEKHAHLRQSVHVVAGDGPLPRRAVQSSQVGISPGKHLAAERNALR